MHPFILFAYKQYLTLCNMYLEFSFVFSSRSYELLIKTNEKNEEKTIFKLINAQKHRTYLKAQLVYL